MRTARQTTLVALLAGVMVGLVADGAFADAKGNVKAERGPSGEFGGRDSLRFSAGGTESMAHGTFTFQESQGYTVTGNVTCYHQEGSRAVFTGPVTEEMNPDLNTESFVVAVTDSDPALAGRDVFNVAGGARLGPDCGTNFPLDIFDNVLVQPFLYYVTSGNIVVR